MIAGPVRAHEAEPALDGQAARQRFLEWLDAGHEHASQLARLCDDVEQRRAGAEAAEAELQRLGGEMEAARQEREALHGERERLQAEVARLTAALSELDAEATALRGQNAALMEERGEAAKLIADRLEDMLVEVLPRLAGGTANGRKPRAAGGATEHAHAGDRPAAAPPPAAVSAPAAVPVPAAPPAAGAPLPASGLALTVPAAPDTPAGRQPAQVVVARDEPVAAHAVAPAPRSALGAPESAEDVMELEDPRRVLFVDDESDFTALLCGHLGASGYEVRAASSGEQALALLPEFNPSVVLLDLMMAGIGGMETLRRIRAARPEIAVIMVTALDDRDIARKALAAGAVDYLTKPVPLDKLTSSVAIHAGGRPLASVPAVREPEPVPAAAAPSPRRTFFARV